MPFFSLLKINPSQLKNGEKRQGTTTTAALVYLMDRAEQTEGLASVRWKQLLVFHLRPLPFATHPSIRPHIHTVVSPRNQNVFYTVCSGGSSNSTLHLKQFFPARGRRYEHSQGKGERTGDYSKSTSHKTLSKCPAHLMMSPRPNHHNCTHAAQTYTHKATTASF